MGFEVRSGWCYGRAALDDYDEAPGTEKLEAGEYRYAVAVGVLTGGEDEEREQLPNRREALTNAASVVRSTE